jgi:hypothetical protein
MSCPGIESFILGTKVTQPFGNNMPRMWQISDKRPLQGLRLDILRLCHAPADHELPKPRQTFLDIRRGTGIGKP